MMQFLASTLKRHKARGRANWLILQQPAQEDSSPQVSPGEKRARLGDTYFVYVGVLLGTLLGTILYGMSLVSVFLGALAGAYFGYAARLARERLRQNREERTTLLELPILLESLILLVESGLGLLPALERVVSQEDQETNPSRVRYLFRKIHQTSMRGVPFSSALQMASEECRHPVVQHVLLHLDVAGNEGGALGPSLRSLAEYTHAEWRTTVETRVRKLENLVVFPVFGAVIGLILLSASVPLVPLMDLKDRLDAQEQMIGGENG